MALLTKGSGKFPTLNIPQPEKFHNQLQMKSDLDVFIEPFGDCRSRSPTFGRSQDPPRVTRELVDAALQELLRAFSTIYSRED